MAHLPLGRGEWGCAGRGSGKEEAAEPRPQEGARTRRSSDSSAVSARILETVFQGSAQSPAWRRLRVDHFGYVVWDMYARGDILYI